MNQFTLGYSDSEDRIWLASSDGARYWLTRRLVAGLMPPSCDLMAKTVPGGEIPHALPAGQRVALEHREALADSPEGKPALEKNKETRQPGSTTKAPILATEVSIHADGRRCTLTVTASRETSRIEMNRMDFHRLLAALQRIAARSGWRLGDLPDWLSEPS